MGASESKLSFKQGVFRLAEEENIPADSGLWAQVRSSRTSVSRKEIESDEQAFWGVYSSGKRHEVQSAKRCSVADA